MSFTEEYIKAKRLIGESLMIIRDNKGLSVSEAAEQSNLSEDEIKSIEAGNTIAQSSIERYADFLGVKLNAAYTEAAKILASYGATIHINLPESGKAASIPPSHEIIAALRKEKKLTQAALAKKLTGLKQAKVPDNGDAPITQAYISRVETGTDPISQERVALFVEALGGPSDIANPYAWLVLEYIDSQQRKR